MGGWCQQNPNKIPVIVTGEDFLIDVFLTKGGPCGFGQPYDLTLATEIVAVLPNADGTTFLEKKLTLGGIILISAPGGHFQIMGSPAESGPLAQNQATALDLRITIGGKLLLVVVQNAINIVPPAYPTAP